MEFEHLIKLIVAGTATLTVPLALYYLVIPVFKAIRRRLEGRSLPEPEVMAELEELRARVEGMQHVERRLGDLEERVDFAERMLAQQKEAKQLKGS